MKGKVVDDFGVMTIEVSYMDKLPMIHKRAENSMRESTGVFKPKVTLLYVAFAYTYVTVLRIESSSLYAGMITLIIRTDYTPQKSTLKK